MIILHSPHIPYNKLLTTSFIYNKTPKKIFMGKSIPTFFQKKQRIIIPGTNRSGSNNLLRPPLISYKLSFSAYGQSFQQSPIYRLSRCFSSHPAPIESPIFLEEKVFLWRHKRCDSSLSLSICHEKNRCFQSRKHPPTPLSDAEQYSNNRS